MKTTNRDWSNVDTKTLRNQYAELTNAAVEKVGMIMGTGVAEIIFVHPIVDLNPFQRFIGDSWVQGTDILNPVLPEKITELYTTYFSNPSV